MSNGFEQFAFYALAGAADTKAAVSRAMESSSLVGRTMTLT